MKASELIKILCQIISETEKDLEVVTNDSSFDKWGDMFTSICSANIEYKKYNAGEKDDCIYLITDYSGKYNNKDNK